MTEIICMANFRIRFGTNQRRLCLINELETYIAKLKNNFSNFRLVIFGSFISDKVNPSDIDILIDIVADPVDKGFSTIYQFKGKIGSLDIFSVRASMHIPYHGTPQTRQLLSADEMVNDFNGKPAHIDKQITCTFAIELA